MYTRERVVIKPRVNIKPLQRYEKNLTFTQFFIKNFIFLNIYCNFARFFD